MCAQCENAQSTAECKNTAYCNYGNCVMMKYLMKGSYYYSGGCIPDELEERMCNWAGKGAGCEVTERCNDQDFCNVAGIPSLKLLLENNVNNAVEPLEMRIYYVMAAMLCFIGASTVGCICVMINSLH